MKIYLGCLLFFSPVFLYLFCGLYSRVSWLCRPLFDDDAVFQQSKSSSRFQKQIFSVEVSRVESAAAAAALFFSPSLQSVLIFCQFTKSSGWKISSTRWRRNRPRTDGGPYSLGEKMGNTMLLFQPTSAVQETPEVAAKRCRKCEDLTFLCHNFFSEQILLNLPPPFDNRITANCNAFFYFNIWGSNVIINSGDFNRFCCKKWRVLGNPCYDHLFLHKWAQFESKY
jgi:hypothetical protein